MLVGDPHDGFGRLADLQIELGVDATLPEEVASLLELSSMRFRRVDRVDRTEATGSNGRRQHRRDAGNDQLRLSILAAGGPLLVGRATTRLAMHERRLEPHLPGGERRIGDSRDEHVDRFSTHLRGGLSDGCQPRVE